MWHNHQWKCIPANFSLSCFSGKNLKILWKSQGKLREFSFSKMWPPWTRIIPKREYNWCYFSKWNVPQQKAQFQNSRLWYYQKRPFNRPERTCCLPCKNGLVVDKEYRNEDFNVITDNSNFPITKTKTLVTIYCPNGNPNLSLFNRLTAYLIMSCSLEI